MSSVSEKTYSQMRIETSMIITNAVTVMNSLGYIARGDNLHNIKQVIKDSSFHLSVVGDFSRGKSTFINAFIGQKVLPAKMRPSTAFINRISYGDEESVTINQLDHQETYSFDAFKKLIAPMAVDDEDDEEKIEDYKQELEKLQQITQADIYLPLPPHLNNVNIYDTPGMNDIYEKREQITKGFLPQSDAVIFLLSATNNLTQSEMEFLRQDILQRHIRKVFFVVNFKDRLQNESHDGERVLDYITKHLKGVDELLDVKIFLVSSLEALNIKLEEAGENVRRRKKVYNTLGETGFVELEQELNNFFEYEQGLIKIDKPMRQFIEKLTTYSEKDLENEKLTLEQEKEKLIQAINLEEQQLKDLEKQFKQELKKYEERLKQSKGTVVQKRKELLRKLIEKVDHFIGDYDGQMTEPEIDEFFDTIPQHAQRWQSEMNDTLEDYVSSIIQEEMQMTLDTIDRYRANHDHHDLTIAEQFFITEGVSDGFLEQNLDDYFKGNSLFSFNTDSVMSAIFETVTVSVKLLIDKLDKWLAPDSYYRKIYNQKKKQLIQGLKQSDQKFNYQIERNWNKIIKTTKKQLDEKLDQNLQQYQEQLHMIKQNNFASQMEIDKRKSEIDAAQEKLEHIKDQAKEYTV
ncbi:GTPase SAR1 family protein [Alkalibacillus flavidus]|uniref:GTPase SAR1 family protein n=1 Tax=Alkalibacillus flavidus TaxID=546021 RepID=A0ABV2KXX2_9BACI